MTKTEATATERQALKDMVRLSYEARGDHSALADVRRQIAQKIDETCAGLRSFGVDTDALLDEIDVELDGEV